jgi:hypothetical protein
MINEILAGIATGSGVTVFQPNIPGVAPAQAAALTQAVAAISQTGTNTNVATSAAGGANTFTPTELVVAPSQVFVPKAIAPQEDIQFRLDTMVNSSWASKVVFDAHGTNALVSLTGMGSACGDALATFNKKLNSGERYMVSRILIEDVTAGKPANFNDMTLTILTNNGYGGVSKRINVSKFRKFGNFYQGAIEVSLMSQDGMIDFNTGWKFDLAPGRVYDITVEFVGKSQ